MGGICSSGGSGVKPNIEEEENEAEELTVGSYFGESTLIKGVPQPRTVRALGRTSLLVLSSEVLQRLCGEDVLKNASVNTPAESSEPKANIVDDDQIRRPANQKKRGSISAGSIEVKKDWVAPVYEHTPEENQRLNEYFAKTTLLSKLDGQRKDTLIGAFQKKEFANGVEIITQGAEGDFYYILDVGSADVFVSKDGAPAQKVLDYGPGGAFGELALMVTEKRQATVRATSECVCWALDRETFHRVMVVGGRQVRWTLPSCLCVRDWAGRGLRPV